MDLGLYCNISQRTWTHQYIAFSGLQRGPQGRTIHTTFGVLREGAFSCSLLCPSSTARRANRPMRPIGIHAGDGSCKKTVSGAVLAAYELQFCIRVDILLTARERSVVSLYYGKVFVPECNYA